MNKNIIFHIIVFLFYTHNVSYSKDTAIKWLEKGIHASNLQEKIRCFEKAIEIDPVFIEAYFKLGCAYSDVGEFNKAEKAFNRALRVSPDNVEDSIKTKIIFKLGKTYLKLGKYKFAKEAFLFAKDNARPASIKSAILYELGNVYLLTEQFDQAISIFDEGIKLNPQNLSSFKTAIKQADSLKQLYTMYREGITHLQQNNYADAEEAFSKIVEIDSNYKDAAEKLKQVNLIKLAPLSNTKFVRFSTLKNENKSQQEKIEQLYQRGIAALENDRWELAASYFTKIKKINPNYKDVNSRLMEANIGMESAAELKKMAKLYDQGLIKFKNKEWLQAIDYFEQIKSDFPDYKDIEFKIAEAKTHLEENKDQVSFTILKNPADKTKKRWQIVGTIFVLISIPIALLFLLSPTMRARYYLSLGKSDRACQLYERILAKHPDKRQIYYMLSNIYLSKNRRDDEALKVYQAVLQTDLDPVLKEKIIDIVGNEYLKRNIINQNSIEVLTEALQNEFKRVTRKS